MLLNNHSHKPTTVFHGSNDYHLGLELEVEAPDGAAKMAGLELAPDTQKYVYAKKDGSLSCYGWELVTHPITRKGWMGQEPEPEHTGRTYQIGDVLTRTHRGRTINVTVKENGFEFDGAMYRSLSAIAKKLMNGTKISGPRFFGVLGQTTTTSGKAAADYVFDLADKLRSQLHYTSHDGGRCGLHIHVSKTAFGTTLQCPHYYWFATLVNGNLFRKLSQRKSAELDRWARQTPVHRLTFADAPNNRYAALNQTLRTVEVRLFRGNLKIARIRKAIEAVVAAIEFAREKNNYDAESAETEFVQYVVANKTTYTNLYSYLVEIGVIRSSDLDNEHYATPNERIEVQQCA